MLTQTYRGERWWSYWLPGGDPNRPPDGRIELDRPTSNRQEDEGYVRYLLRTKIRVTRLPVGTVVVPSKTGVR